MTAAIHGWAEPCGCTRTRTTAMSGLAAVDRKLEGGASGRLPSSKSLYSCSQDKSSQGGAGEARGSGTALTGREPTPIARGPSDHEHLVSSVFVLRYFSPGLPLFPPLILSLLDAAGLELISSSS